ncbi:MAG: DUF881 domain-containing protein [Heliobacteriaceae bacterium]|nr:DUF881 domain-containing protein [Heliobacteriaceae bacterium]
MDRRNQAVVVLTLVCFFIGVSTMIQWRTQTVISQRTASYSVDELTSTLIQAEQGKDALLAQLTELRSQLERYREGESARQSLSNTLEKTRLVAGLASVEGPGLVITLDDSPMAQQLDTSRKDNRNDYFIHDWYIRELVNALFTGGAEAISVNHQRLISTSEIFCGGTTIFINRDYITPPFVIKAVGEPKSLLASVNMVTTSLMLKDLQQRYGITFDLAPQERVIVPGYSGEVKFNYARIAAGTEFQP